ncbi:MAG: hypothetical protein GEV07_23135 [Streptosporangiales bacterium]|nr:hypothetical protein [Streptosporangiales bacterium]
MALEQPATNSRRRARRIVESGPFQRAVLLAIFVNAVTIGMQTSPELNESYGGFIRAVDVVVVVAFSIEIALRLYAYGTRFFRDPWNWFDLVVVAVAIVPPTHYFSVVRVLRVLRLARLVSVVPSLRRVVAALLSAVPGIGSIIVMLMVALYSGAVLGVQLFRSVAPEDFGSLDRSLLTMFAIMTLGELAGHRRADRGGAAGGLGVLRRVHRADRVHPAQPADRRDRQRDGDRGEQEPVAGGPGAGGATARGRHAGAERAARGGARAADGAGHGRVRGR